MRRLAVLLAVLAAGCVPPPQKPVVQPLPPVGGPGAVALPRISGRIDAPLPVLPVSTSLALPSTLAQ